MNTPTETPDARERSRMAYHAMSGSLQAPGVLVHLAANVDLPEDLVREAWFGLGATQVHGERMLGMLCAASPRPVRTSTSELILLLESRAALFPGLHLSISDGPKTIVTVDQLLFGAAIAEWLAFVTPILRDSDGPQSMTHIAWKKDAGVTTFLGQGGVPLGEQTLSAMGIMFVAAGAREFYTCAKTHWEARFDSEPEL